MERVFQKPERLEAEHGRRLKSKSKDDPIKLDAERKAAQNKIARIIDTYADGLITKVEFEPRIKHAKCQLTKIDQQTRQLADEAQSAQQLQLIIVRLDEFAAKLKGRLETIDWETKRQIIRALVRKVEIGQDEANVVFRVTSLPFDLAPAGGESSQHCNKRAFANFK